MRILIIHNYYRQRGGEDIVFEAESRLLERYGHEVAQEVFHNDEIADDLSLTGSARLALSTVWSRTSQKRVAKRIEAFQPDVVHVHNTFPLISPAVFRTIHRLGIPVVQTLHNYRTLCAKVSLFRDGKVCHDCVARRVTWPAVQHACYQGSRSRTAAIVAMQSVHRLAGTWTEYVDLHIATTAFARDLFIESGLAPESIVVKPNYVDPDLGPGSNDGRFVLFVGRLSSEKGLGTLLQSWEQLYSEMKLKIAGTGPLNDLVEEASRRDPSIEWLGHVSEREVLELMGAAEVVVFPSEGNETFGRTIIEAYSRGTPVVASNIGSARELVVDGETGMLYPVGDPKALADTLNSLLRDQASRVQMGEAARVAYDRLYSAGRNYRRLVDIYDMTITRARQLNRRARQNGLIRSSKSAAI